MSDTAGTEVEVSVDGEVARWVSEIKLYEKEAEKWVSRSKKIIKRFKDEREPNDKKYRFNILWSNVQTLLPALYTKNPVVNVERRFHEDDDAGRMASLILERCIAYFVDDKFYDCMRQVTLDRCLPGRGTMMLRYKPVFGETKEITEDTDAEAAEAAQPELYSEEVICDYIHWQDFGHTFGRTWEEIRAPWRKVYMTREDLVERFGKEVGNAIPLDYSPTDKNSGKDEAIAKKATVYEIWDKAQKKFKWLHKDYPKLLDAEDDPLRLKEFYPCPRPLFATLGNDTIIPVPDYAEYQDQAQELDDLTARITSLTKSVKVVGAYDASAEGLQRMLTEGADNMLVEVQNWAMFAEKGGLNGAVSWLPLDQVVNALKVLHESREKAKQDLYEISGMSDIIRGQGEAGETATGTRVKGQFATLRLNAMQGDVSRFARDAVRIIGEIICSHFQPETIKAISGVKLLTQAEKQAISQVQQAQALQQQPPGQLPPGQPPAALPMPELPPELMKLMDDEERLEEMMDNATWEEIFELLKNDNMRCFRIDIETDSTIKADQDAEKQARTEFLQAAGGFIQQAIMVGNPDLYPLLMQMLMFGIRGFHVGKELESTFKVAMKKIDKASKRPQQQPPDPEAQKMQMQMQMEQQKAQLQMQMEAKKNEIESQRAAQAQQLEEAKAAREQQREDAKMAHDMKLEEMRLKMDHNRQQQEQANRMQEQQFTQGLENNKIQSAERMKRAEISAGKQGGELAADVEGLAEAVEQPNKLDLVAQTQTDHMNAAIQANQQILQAMQAQMAGILEIAKGLQATTETMGAVHKSVSAPKRTKVERDASGKIVGATQETVQ